MRMSIFAASFVVGNMYMPVQATAQGGSCNPAILFRNLTPTAFLAAAQACGADDVAAVIADAKTPPEDHVALACMEALQGIVQAKQQGGLLLIYQRYRRARQTNFISACTAWANPVAP